jgi:hypothetical protein
MACDIPLKLTVLLSFAVLLLIPLKAGVSFGINDEMLVVPKSEKPAEINGNWSTKTEWTDASEIKVQNEELTAYIRAKHDGVFVYLLVDFLSDYGLDVSGDFAIICFDTNNNRGNVPQSDDYCFYRITRTGDATDGILQGNGSGWTVLQESDIWDPYDEKFDAAVSYSHLNDPYDSINNHVIYEFRIPIDLYSLNETMSFYVYTNDAYTGKFFEWPTNAGGKQYRLVVKDVLPAPDKWADLQVKINGGDTSSEPKVQEEEKPLEKELEEENADVRVQARQIKDLIIVRLRNMDDSRADVYAFKIVMVDSTLNGFKGPKDWSKENVLENGALFSSLTRAIGAGDKEYFLLKVDTERPLIQWTVYGPDNREVGEGSVTPFLK